MTWRPTRRRGLRLPCAKPPNQALQADDQLSRFAPSLARRWNGGIVGRLEANGLEMAELTSEDWRRVDGLLARSNVLSAVALYREVAGCGIGDAKDAVGERFRQVFPDLWQKYRDVEDRD